MSKIKVVVPISGGKDSQCCIKLALKIYSPDEILGLFCDTKFEHPLTYLHIEEIKSLYGIEIKTINAGTVQDKVRKYQRFPGGGARFCTDELKIQPSIKFYKYLAKEQKQGFEVWYGVRTEESTDRKNRYEGKISDEVYAPHEFMSKYPKYLSKLGVVIRLPVIDWTKKEILDYLNGEENELYRLGFDRVGCFPCLASGDKWKEKAFRHDEFGQQQLKEVRILESEIGKSVWTSKGGKYKDENGDLFDNPGCSFCEL